MDEPHPPSGAQLNWLREPNPWGRGRLLALAAWAASWWRTTCARCAARDHPFPTIHDSAHTCTLVCGHSSHLSTQRTRVVYPRVATKAQCASGTDSTLHTPHAIVVDLVYPHTHTTPFTQQTKMGSDSTAQACFQNPHNIRAELITYVCTLHMPC